MGELAEAGTMAEALAKFLRISISGGREIISLAEEIEHIRNYLVILQMRYADGYRSGADLIIEVIDNGAGMTEESLFQLRRALRDLSAQSGFGLINVQRRLHLHYGTAYGLTVESVPGEGTTVRVRLPVMKEEM